MSVPREAVEGAAKAWARALAARHPGTRIEVHAEGLGVVATATHPRALEVSLARCKDERP